MSTTTTMLDRLRDETREMHAHVESLPFWAALQDGTLPREAYVLFLEAMLAVHEPLEQAADADSDAVLTAAWDRAAARVPLLERDLSYLWSEHPGGMSKALLHAIMLSEEVALRARRDPASLVGYLYVLQGSALGGLVLRPQVVRTFGLTGQEGVAYLGGSGHETRRSWTAFTEAMNAAVLEPDLQERVVDAALEAFEGIGRIVENLHPLDADDSDTLGQTLNPGAGLHSVAEDPRELRAALRAGVRSWERFPYYERRYGRRGRRFTRSDSAWLVTLAALPQAEVDRQIRWLGQVLAARGMPRWLLELHLEVLHQELTLALPEASEDYLPLLSAAQHLRDQRTAVFEENAWDDLAASFDAAVGAQLARELPGSGGLLVAAVADEALGVRNAVSSLEGWLTDPARFPPSWVAAVRHTLQRARELAQAAGQELRTGTGSEHRSA